MLMLPLDPTANLDNSRVFLFKELRESPYSILLLVLYLRELPL